MCHKLCQLAKIKFALPETRIPERYRGAAGTDRNNNNRVGKERDTKDEKREGEKAGKRDR